MVGGTDPVFAELGYQTGRALTTFAGHIVVVGVTGSGNGAIWVGPGAPAPGPTG
jgi:hypothetical protein